MFQMEFIVQLGTAETNATTWLKTLRIVINLTRGVSWTDAEIKTNILEITMGHGYLIEWPCDVLDTGSHYEAPQTRIPLLGWESYHLMGQEDSVVWNLLPTAKKKLGFIVFILYSDAANFITMSHYAHDIQSMSQCMNELVLELHVFSVMLFIIKLFLHYLDLLLRSVEHSNIKVANSERAVLQWDIMQS